MKRILAISDVHGCYEEFCELLIEVKYDPSEDKLILLGDYTDRGDRSKDVIELVRNMVNEHGVVAIRGNHDQLFLNFLDNPTYEHTSIFISNGGYKTLNSYLGEESTDFTYARQYILENYSSHYGFLKSLPYYHETENHIFLHAGINPMVDDWKQTSPNEMFWIREFFINNPTRTDKTVVFGHTPTLNIHGNSDIWMGGDKIGIDGACCYGFQLNCLEISDEGYKTYSVKSKTKQGN